MTTDAPDPTLQTLATTLRERRNGAGLSCAQLAAKADVSAGMISDIENAKKNPTIRVVNQLANALGVTISDLLGLEAEQPAVTLTKKAKQQVLVDSETGVERHLLSPALVRRGIQVILYVVPPRTSEVFPPEPPGGFEHVTITRGSLVVRVGDEYFDLEEGDSLTYPADVEHALDNPSDFRVEYILVIDSTRVGR